MDANYFSVVLILNILCKIVRVTNSNLPRSGDPATEGPLCSFSVKNIMQTNERQIDSLAKIETTKVATCVIFGKN